MKRSKRLLKNGIELPNHDSVRTLIQKETHRYLEILEADTIKQQEMKEKKLERVSQGNQKTTRDKNITQNLSKE